ncbi:MAG: hypothetical protein ACXACP_01005, partial [Candidatus Hodarchaeales archaeon]
EDMLQKEIEEINRLENIIEDSKLEFFEENLEKAGLKFRKAIDFFTLANGEKNEIEVIIQEEKVDIKPIEVRYFEERLDIKEAYFILFMRTIKILIKTPIFYILLVNFLLRLPRSPHAMGDDAFLVVWMAKALLHGGAIFWEITPLSLFGMYPFSTYPIGGPTIMALIMIFFSEEVSIFLFSMIFTGVSIISSYYLAKLIFNEDQLSIFFFVIFFTTSPIFLRFSHWTSSMRGPFLSFIPLVLYTTFRLVSDFTWRNFLLFCVSLFFLGMTHQLAAIFCGIFFVSVVIALITNRLDLLNYKYSFGYLFIYACAFISGIIILPIDTSKTAEFLLTNDTIVGIIWNLGVDYFLRIGLIFPLAFLGFFIQFVRIYKGNYPFDPSRVNPAKSIPEFSIFPKSEESREPKPNTENNSQEILYLTVFLVFGVLLALVSPISKYASLFFLPWFAFYSVIGVRFLLGWGMNYLNYTIGCLPLVFGLFYSFFVIFLPLYVLGALALAIFSVGNFLYERKNIIMHSYEYIKIILFFSIVIISLISTDGLTYQLSGPYQFPLSYMSDDELQISNYLKEFNQENRIIIVFNPTVARRIHAMTFQQVLFPSNSPATVYYNYISSEEVRNQTKISIMSLFSSGIPFSFTGENPEKTLRNSFLGLDFNDSDDLMQAISLRLGYLVIENTTTPLWRSQWGTTEVALFTSILHAGTLLIETKYLRLYEIPTL